MCEQCKHTMTSHASLMSPLRKYAAAAVHLFEELVPGATQEEKRSWCTRAVVQTLEALDGHVPLVGALLDTPIADAVEKRLAERLVDCVLKST